MMMMINIVEVGLGARYACRRGEVGGTADSSVVSRAGL